MIGGEQPTSTTRFLFAFFLYCVAGQTTSEISETHDPSLSPPPGIIGLISKVRVPYGRSVNISPISNLHINVAEGDHCFVTVLQSPFNQRPGQISPGRFPCEFSAHDVEYLHFGSRSPSEDYIPLQIRYDSPTNTYIIPVRLSVEVLFVQRSVVTTSMFLTVSNLTGTSNPLSNGILEFTYDPLTQQCQVATLSGAGGLPRYGILIDDPSQGNMIPCSEFLEAGLRYQHTAETNSPNRDHIPMVVQLLDNNGNKIKQEYFQVAVKIVNGLENTAPRIAFSSILMMQVNQFVMTAFTNEMIQATDIESDPDQLIFNITSPLGAQDGEIVSTDDRNTAITSFRQRDVNDLRIAYKPPSSDSSEPRFIQLQMQIVDTEGMVSDLFEFIIVVNPMNTLAPVVTRNTGQLLYQGQSRPLLSSQNLEISDEDNLDDVRIKVLRGANHGRLISPRKFFTAADLKAGRVVYQHDGSNTYSDNIIFRMTDGTNEVEFLFPIVVAPLDNTPPSLETNTGMTVNKGETLLVSSWVLNAVDVDTNQLAIKFVLEEPYSSIGQFLLVRPDVPEGNDSSLYRLRPDGQWERPTYEWTERDIINKKLYYRHIGSHSTKVVMDTYSFRVQDDSDPPNVSDLFEFVVKVLPVDDIPPFLYPNTTLHMNVKEFELTAFNKKMLRYTDLDTADKDLVYNITGPIEETNPIVALPGAGKIVLTENPQISVTSFTQAQVNHHKVAYQPPNTELGIVSRTMRFAFKVIDGAGNKLPNQIFSIHLFPVNNKPPSIVNTGFTVNERSAVVIMPNILDAYDEDTDENMILFALTSKAKHGELLYDSAVIEIGGTFSKSDIAAGDIIYQHNGDELDSDNFHLDVSDGMHTIPIVVRITVRPIDDELPLLAPSHDGTLNFNIEVPERGRVFITSEVLSATDTDTDDLDLIFLITGSPSKGQIMVNEAPSNNFTQKNIRDKEVTYQHSAGEIGQNPDKDSFGLLLSDLSDDWNVGGNRVDKVVMNVKITPLDTEAPFVTVTEELLVKESKKSMIEPIHLDATDIDTDINDILCVITIQASEGFVENISPAPGSEKSRKGIPISSFTIADIRSGNIFYVQSNHENQEPTQDRFAFICQDGAPNLSERSYVNIAISPVNDEKPILYHTEFVVEEGGILVVDLPKLYAEDSDVPEDELNFTVVEPPTNGRFVRMAGQKQLPVTSFTLRDVATGSEIVYEHDDTETTEDKFEIKVSDGKYESSAVIPITILPMDDETPRLTINNGIDVEIMETKVIGNTALKATDLDSVDSNLIYVIKFSPQHGKLSLTNRNGVSMFLGVNSTFTQSDIDQERLTYTHNGHEGVRDLIKFDVTDGFNPLIDRYFYVNVAYMDMLFPDVINKGVTLKEGGRVTLTTDILSTADMNSADENLAFAIEHAPQRGHLESTDHPGVPITSFTQLELAGNKIQYVHTGDDEIKMDSFEFEVTDGFNPVYRTFRISISDVDNKKPVVTMTTLRLKEGSGKLITPFELKVDDRDTNDDLLRVHITQVPVHGRILLDDARDVRDFTMSDLNENRISYLHDGSETSADSFSFTVTDGTHDDFYIFPNTVFATKDPQRMDIEIVPVDNGVPQMLVNRGAPSLSTFSNGSRGFRITKKILRADDRDSNVTALQYVITRQPSQGKIVNLDEDNDQSVDAFSQGSIDGMTIYYILDNKTNATSDSFQFLIRDTGGNELTNQVFRLNWAVISLESANYRINETDKQLVVTLKRRGYLGETSFVTIGTQNGTAKSGKDFRGKSQSQVQFNPGQTERTWKISVLQDEEFENSEDFFVVLSEPVMAILEDPKNASVVITDPEDESTVSIPSSLYKVDEKIGELLIPLRRTGDLRNEFMVICYTIPGSASGTIPTTVHSFADYISRPEDHNSIITFGRNESEKVCRVFVIDDSLYENDESFNVTLTSPMGGRLGSFPSAEILIKSDQDDEPLFYFDQSFYEVDETDGHVSVRVWRTGTDLTKTATVTLLSKESDPESATANVDYVGISRTLEFAPGTTMQTVDVAILDDLGSPVLEGNETFDLVLRMPVQAILGEPSKTQILINDSFSDLPLMEFAKTEYEINEHEKSVTALIQRSGDLSHSSAVRCYTRQATAQVTSDYAERPNTDASLVRFKPGESEGKCIVIIEDDKVHEDPEEFRLMLGTASSETAGSARVGDQNEALITILDDSDRSIIEFGQTTFEVTEPPNDDEPSILLIPVVRGGDLSQPSLVRVYTKDGNAESGKDYNPVSRVLSFDKDVDRVEVKIEILFDGEKEIRESFTVRLEPDENMVSELGEKRAIVYINQQKILADVTFPSKPSVVSLLDYDDMDNAATQPSPGYPVVCVSPCNPKHKYYKDVSSICESEGLDDSGTQFRWLVAAPSGVDSVTNRLREVGQRTFFTDTNRITLDSIYFKSGSRVACAARAVNMDGEIGLESLSLPVTISSESSICPPRVAGSVGAEPFSAKIRYTGPAEPSYPNLVRISIAMPHIDGMLPVISTRKLSNFEITLSRDGTRIGNHRCSNIINFDEKQTRHGFLTNSTRNPNIVDETYPYRYNSDLRGKNALRFYRNLNLEACLWEFTTYYDMSELLTECGGNIGTDGQVLDLVQSYVSLRVPLFVSYVFHSPVGKGWQHFDQQTELRMAFVYDTAILWDQGIATPPEAELQGYLYPTSMRIGDDGRLFVHFRTEARFRGQFVPDHSGSPNVAMVMSESHPELQMTLKLIRSEATYNNPEQKWSFESDYAIRDYSGTYTIKLVPCVTPPGKSYDIPIVCNPRDPISFDMDIRFQQVSDPVAEEFSLDTNFYLLSKKSLYLSDGSMGFAEDSDAAFTEGDEIYGRVLVDPVQNLGNSFDTSIEKIFVCAGKDGYVPKYNPENQEYGCLADTPQLRERLKILDKEQPETQDAELNNVGFNAKLALDDPESLTVVRQPGTDGFRMDSTPLFSVTVGREWYMHAIYTVRAINERRRRSAILTYHSMIHSSERRSKRAASPLTDSIGKDFNRGTQMKHVNLHTQKQRSSNPPSNANGSNNGILPNEGKIPILYILIGVASLVLIVVTVLIAALVRRRRSKRLPHDDDKGRYTGGKNIVIRRNADGKTKASVVSKRSSSGYSSSDNSEV